MDGGHRATAPDLEPSPCTPYDITTIDGDGIGPEVCQSAVAVLREACGSRLRFTPSRRWRGALPATGAVLPDDTWPPAAQRMPSCTAPPACPASPTRTAPRSATTCTCSCASSSTCLPTCGRSGCTGVTSPLRAGGRADRLRDRAREHRRPVRQPRRRREPARRAGTDTLVVTRKGVERVARFSFELARAGAAARRATASAA
jgi:3-isopropylmalate dehydrogenase